MEVNRHFDKTDKFWDLIDRNVLEFSSIDSIFISNIVNRY